MIRNSMVSQPDVAPAYADRARMSPWSALKDVWTFIALTFVVSLTAGLGAFALGGSRTFETPRALPLLLVTIWSPNLAALAVAARRNGLGDLARRLRLGHARQAISAWLLALLPLGVSIALAARTPSVTHVPLDTIALLMGMNLIMGPLGEELGFRGWLLPRLSRAYGPLAGALLVGVIWALWHLPLWWLPSPQRAIPFEIFLATVVCFSLVMTVMAELSAYGIWPSVLFHLMANVGVGWLELRGGWDAASAYRAALPMYACAAVVAAAWLSQAGRGTRELTEAG